MAEDQKAVHSIVLDAAPLIANTPPISTLLKKAEQIFTTPSVISEIKDAAARARLETLVMPFITLRTPSANSTKFVVEFARKSGDFAVLSKTDIEVIALAYELECERNGGDWRLRKSPGQKTVNGSPPARKLLEQVNAQDDHTTTDEDSGHPELENIADSTTLNRLESSFETTDTLSSRVDLTNTARAVSSLTIDSMSPKSNEVPDGAQSKQNDLRWDLILRDLPECLSDTETTPEPAGATASSVTFETGASTDNDESLVPTPTPDLSSDPDEDEDSDGGEWITPSNIIRHKTSSQTDSTISSTQAKTLQVATITTDYALQNTLMLINLNLLSSSLTRISHVRSHILRCHACFATTKQIEKQFCPRCGQPTLTRVSTSTNANGTTTLHLKKNMQWNTRGNRYSIPKPVAGSSNGKMREKGGGKGGWGKNLILAEDQKEYVRAVRDRDRERRQNEHDLLDQDFLPGIMGGGRSHTSNGRIQIGAGRTVNSRKKK